jgi:F-type H+-transporting ATPase subunit delta
VKLSSIAQRYARALFESAQAAGRLEQVAADFAAFIELLHQNTELRRVLIHPALAPRKKEAVLEQLQRHQLLEPRFHHFLRLTARKGRIERIEEIHAAFVRRVDQQHGLLAVEALSATDFDPPLRARLTERLRELSGREIQLELRTEPALMGGLVLRCGNRVLDASLKGQLQRLHQRLRAGA